ncbi:protein RICE SALT SENSITIVE 3-like isoform X2 [Cornus florida]|uniref:protein RICE SALT SENSITIVE 3-like isoform X2 n=1 Tax=Cornus florida TaxID=4283 RepID=UPI00289E4A3C|nr:protein RICE SALT SENSITIVE 3-like isoform X2 [Cornus florida]
MEEQMSSLCVTHLLQHTLRSLCIHQNSQWVYAVFWRILPRNYPPPQRYPDGRKQYRINSHGKAYDRSRGNMRNWILVWEDGFCNFAATTAAINGGDSSESSVYGSSCESDHHHQGLQPELFFKMSHEIYNYGEGLIGKVAADQSHKWIYDKEPSDQEINYLSSWHNSTDSHPRTWEAQFKSGIKTIALIAVREGVVQLGAIHKVIEDLNYVVILKKKLSYIESIPGVLLPHPSSSSSEHSFKMDGYGFGAHEAWHFHTNLVPPTEVLVHDHFNQPVRVITPSMSSLEALLSKLPSVVPPPPSPLTLSYGEARPLPLLSERPMKMAEKGVAKEEADDDHDAGESSRLM